MIKKHWKKIVIIMIAIIISMSIGTYAAIVLDATEVTYDRNGTTMYVNTALDELYAKASNAAQTVFNQGQLVTYQGEEFYSLYDVTSEDTTMEIFAKTNLDSNATAQTDATYSTTGCVFSSTKYWSSLWPGGTCLNLNNVTGYVAGDTMDKVNIYARTKGAISGRLLTIEEVVDMTNTPDLTNYYDYSSLSNTTIKDMIEGKGNTTQSFENYWLGAPFNELEDRYVYVAYGMQTSYGIFDYDVGGYFGVRPVLNVYKSMVTDAS